MDLHVIETRNKILEIINHIISKKKEINVKISGQKTVFTSLILKLNKPDNAGDSEKDNLIIERLEPKKGMDIIHSNPDIEVKFDINEKSFRFSSKFLGINNIQQPFGLFISIPDSIEFENKRINERYTYEVPEFVTAEFKLGQGTREEKNYELNVLDCSLRGLGLLVDKENIDLLQRIKIGETIQEITFYAAWMMIKVTGSVKHITKIGEGAYKGRYLMGIESQDIIKICRPKGIKD